MQSDQPNIDPGSKVVLEIMKKMLGVYWTAYAQHQTHVSLLRTWSIEGLAASMEARISDEPQTIKALSSRLLDLGGNPSFALSPPLIGTTLREVLENDMALQAKAKPEINAAIEAAAAAHDATSRILFEGILADEEEHFFWLESELKLLDLLGEPLYVANRLNPVGLGAQA